MPTLAIVTANNVGVPNGVAPLNASGAVPVANGGTGVTSLPDGALSVAGGIIAGGTLPVALGGTGTTVSTGSGEVVLATAPILSAPVIQGGSINGTAIGDTIAVSINASSITTQTLSVAGITTTSTTGTGSMVLSNSPSLTTPNLGVPSGVVLTNATGLPLSTGVSGILPVASGGTGVATITGLVKGNADSAFTSAVAGTDYLAPSALGVANGIATLDATGKLTSAQVPDFLLGSLNYQGTWDASTNTPTLATGVGSKGFYYKVSVAGTTDLDGNDNWNLGDLAIFDGTAWGKVDGVADQVLSVNGQTGAVVITRNLLGAAAAGANSDITSLSGLTTALSVAQGGTGVTTSTGTGSVVLSSSPVLVTPDLGTPTAVDLANATGLPLSTGVTGVLAAAQGGTGANTLQGAINALAGSASTGHFLRGDGANVVMSTIQASDVPMLNQNTTGTASTVTAANQPAITGLGTLTSLTVNGTVNLSGTTSPLLMNGVAGTAGHVLMSGGPGTTPSWAALSSATVTSIDVSGGTTGLSFAGGPITTAGTLTMAGTLAVANGGTGTTTATGSGSVVLADSPTLTTPNLGTPSAATLTNATGLPLSTGVTGILPVANGGTGAATAVDARAALGAAASGANSDITALSGLTTALSVSQGGTGTTTSTGSGAVVLANAPTLTGTATATTLQVTTQLSLLTNASLNLNGSTGSVGQILTSAGPGAAPTWTTVSGAGTVVSVDASGGMTGLTFSGGPITSGGTLTLEGTLTAPAGGTGFASYTAGDLLYAASTTALAKLAAVAAGSVLLSNGAGAAPVYGKVDLASHVTGTLPVANGGTGTTTSTGSGSLVLATAPTIGSPVISGGTINSTVIGGVTAAAGTFTALAADAGLALTGGSSPVTLNGTAGTIGQALLSAGPGATPTWGAVGTVTSVAADGGTTGLTFSGGPVTGAGTLTVGGILAVAHGGTGVTTSTGTGSVVLSASPTLTGTLSTSNVTVAGTLALSGASSPVTLNSSAGTAGQVLTSAGPGATPTWATVTGTGSVTSVDVSGGTTGLTVSGGPITGAGTLTLGGTLAVANGGTGVTTSTGSGSVVLSASPTFTGTTTLASVTVAGTIDLSGTASPLALNGSAGTVGQVLTSAGPGATPTWSSAVTGVITSATTINVPADYPTIQAALASLATMRLAADVTIKVADGTYTLTTSITVVHPDGAKIKLLGNTTTPANVVIKTSGAPTFDALVVSDGNTLSSVDGFTFTLDAKATSANNYTAILANNGAYIRVGPKVVVNNWYYGIAARAGSTIYCRGVTVTNAGDVGIWAFDGSTVDATGATSNNASDSPNYGFGFQAEYGSQLDASNATASGNLIGGIAALSGSNIRALSAVASTNIGSGFFARDGGTIEATGSTANTNTRYGIEILADGHVYGTGITLTSNTLGTKNSQVYFDNGSLGARMLADGGDLRIDNAGTYNTYFNTSGGAQFQVAHTASVVNRVSVTGAATGSAPTIAATGSDTDIGLTLVPKGSGGISATRLSNTGTLTLSGSASPLVLNASAGTAGQVLTSAGPGATPTWTTVSGTGTVTSVNVSGGTTGLSFSGGPVTSTGTITMSGTLAVANGGTGVTTSTGSGSVVLSASPTLTGTVSAGAVTLTSTLSLSGTSAPVTLNGSAGVAGQILTSAGPGATPTWTTISGTGTVTSVAMSGGTTGLSFSGSPITTAGTITLAGTLGTANGGTGLTTYTAGDLIYASNSSTLAKLTSIAAGNVLLTGGVGVAPTWGKVNLTAHVSNTLPVANGGTGVTTSTGSGSVVLSVSPTLTGVVSTQDVEVSGTLNLYGATSPLMLNSNPGTAGQVLRSAGPGATPTWAAASSGTVTSVAMSGGTTGLTFSGGPITGSGTFTLGGALAVANGGTGATAVTGSGNNVLSDSPTLTGTVATSNITVLGDLSLSGANSPLVANGSAGTAGQILVSGGASTTPVWTSASASLVGLSNVDNTSDANKPVSTATQTALSGKEPTINAGTTAQYLRGDKTWRDFFTDVRAATLTGLSTATNAVITAADTVLQAIGKLQAQITGHKDAAANAHLASAIDLASDPSGLPGALTAGTVQQRMEDIFDEHYSVASGLAEHQSGLSIKHPASTIGNIPAGNIAATDVQAAINELDSEKFAKTGGDITGNVTFTGTSRRIRIPYIGIPVGNRTLFQSSDADTATYIGVIPNGTQKSSGITFSNSSDPDNAGYGYISMSDVGMIITSAVALGTGGTGGAPGAVPLTLVGRGGAGITLGDGAVAVTSGVLGYGPGSGGTVTQATSKSTAVTLNKPCGRITLHNSELAAGATVAFSLVNDTISQTDFVGATTANPFGNYAVRTGYTSNGSCTVYVTNTAGSNLSEAVIINFVVFKGATS